MTVSPTARHEPPLKPVLKECQVEMLVFGCTVRRPPDPETRNQRDEM